MRQFQHLGPRLQMVLLGLIQFFLLLPQRVVDTGLGSLERLVALEVLVAVDVKVGQAVLELLDKDLLEAAVRLVGRTRRAVVEALVLLLSTTVMVRKAGRG